MAESAAESNPPARSWSEGYFEQLYSESPDPWGLATRWYEQRKYAITVAALPRQRYRNAYEPGCSFGVLTRMLAPRCERLLAVDFAASVLERARARLSQFPQVRLQQAALPREMPDDRYDLIVVSEMLYYLSEQDLELMIEGLVRRLEPGGDLVAVHHCPPDHYGGYDGITVHAALTACPDLVSLTHHEDSEFVLDVLRRKDD